MNAGINLEIPVKSLNLHERCQPVDMNMLSVSTIKLTGNFDNSDALLWISNCINDLPMNIEGKT